MIIKDLQYIKDTQFASKIRGRSLSNFRISSSLSSALFNQAPLPDSSLSLPSIADDPGHPMLWRLPDLTSGRITPNW